MRTITRTITGARLQSYQWAGLPYEHLPFTTLNEKFNIFPDRRPDPGEMPRNRVFTIGNRGHRVAVGADGFPLTDDLQHAPTDGSLYGPVPFILRRATDDLDTVTRSKFRLRREEVHDGLNYIAYYGKVMDMTGVTPRMFYNEVVDGQTVSTPWVPSSSNLNPPIPSIPPTGTVTTSGNYMSVSMLMDLSLTANDIAEYIEAAKIIYGDERYAIISELGIVAGCDKTVSVTGLNYVECVEAQVTAILIDYHALRYSNNGLTLTVDVGAVEPLLVAVNGSPIGP